jgi:hypothetical protein
MGMLKTPPFSHNRSARARQDLNTAQPPLSPTRPTPDNRPLSNVDDILDSFATNSVSSFSQAAPSGPFSAMAPTAPLAVRPRQGPPSPFGLPEQYGKAAAEYAIQRHSQLSIQSSAGVVGHFPSSESFQGDSPIGRPKNMPSPGGSGSGASTPTSSYFPPQQQRQQPPPASPTRRGFGPQQAESPNQSPPRGGFTLVDSPIRQQEQPKGILKKPLQAPGTPSVFVRSESRQSGECLVDGRESYHGVQQPVRKISLTRGAQPVVLTREESLRRHDREDTVGSNVTEESEGYNGIGSSMLYDEEPSFGANNATPPRHREDDSPGRRGQYTPPTASESETSSEVIRTPPQPPRLSLAPPAPLAFPRKLVDDNGEFMPLSQMNLAQQQPDYRSPTLSVYDFYGDGGGDPARFSQAESAHIR